MAAAFDAVEFVARHGVVLASAKGAVPSLAEAVAGEPIHGSWWGHVKGAEIFRALSAVGDSPDVLCLKLIDGRVTFVHRRLWPALVRLADVLGKERLAAVRQEHTASGAHRNVVPAFPEWVAEETMKQARGLSEREARTQLGSWIETVKEGNRAGKQRTVQRARSRR